MEYCTIGIIAHYGFTALWFCIIAIIWHYDIGGKKKPDGMGIGSRRKKAGALAVSRILLNFE